MTANPLFLPNDMSDEQLMLQYSRGDGAAFKVLYLRYKMPLTRFLYLQLGNDFHIEEILHDIWIGIIDLSKNYQPTAKFKTLLYRIAHNRIVDSYRRKKIVYSISQLEIPEDQGEEWLDENSNLETLLINEQTIEGFLSAINALPAAQREVFLLKQETGLKVKDIADIMGIDMEAAQSRLRYAKAKLLAAIKEICDE